MARHIARPVPYDHGLVEVGNGCHAYLQPDGGWGWSNAGLIAGDGASLLVDTLFDLKLTAAMLEALAPLTGDAPIGTVVNTHANGDHCYGNQLVAGAEIIGTTATAHEMRDVPASMLQSLNDAPGDVGELFRAFFGAFDFRGIVTTPPTRTFDGSLTVEIGGRRVELIELGPAHTQGDAIAHVPDAAVIYTGDLLFSRGTPIAWAGPLSRWVAACDRIIELAPSVVVPGHGPVSTLAEVRDCREYLAMVEREATARHDAGMTAAEAARDIALGDFADWGEFGRIAVNVDNVYRHLDSAYVPADIVEMFREMATIEAARRGGPS
jgi:glyoxylase-like metal-dependent hydrolase (beta-lactamase superfamily II)